jgi:hypothetical protein
MAKKSETIDLRVRMPVGIHKRLVVSAEHNMRSLNQEVLWALSRYLVGDHKIAGDIARGVPPFDTEQKVKGKKS